MFALTLLALILTQAVNAQEPQNNKPKEIEKESAHQRAPHGGKPTPLVAHDTETAHRDAEAGDDIATPKYAVAVFQATKGNEVKGTLMLQETEKGLHVWGEVSGLSPGDHGFHIHEFGDLRSDDGMATGSHFSAEGKSHGDLNHDKSHEGDFGNINAGSDGVAKVDLTSKGLKLHYVLGRAFVVHAKADDLTSQPAGNAGARIGVALIGVSKAH
jgi:Cu-Zn family superoxide dismutase